MTMQSTYDVSTDLDPATARSLIGKVVTVTTTDKKGNPPAEVTGKVSLLAIMGSTFMVLFEHGAPHPSFVDLDENTVAIETA